MVCSCLIFHFSNFFLFSFFLSFLLSQYFRTLQYKPMVSQFFFWKSHFIKISLVLYKIKPLNSTKIAQTYPPITFIYLWGHWKSKQLLTGIMFHKFFHWLIRIRMKEVQWLIQFYLLCVFQTLGNRRNILNQFRSSNALHNWFLAKRDAGWWYLVFNEDIILLSK